MTARAQKGFTLVELMVSLVVFSFAVAGILAVAVSMAQGFRDQRAAIGAEGAARVPLDFLADALRQASPGAPTGNITDSNTCSTYALKVTDNYGGNGWDLLDVIYASGAVVTTSTAQFTTGGSGTLSVIDGSGFANGDYLVISDTGQGHLYQVSSGGGTTSLTLSASGSCTAHTYAAGALVIRAQHALFYIATVDNIPTLMMNNAPTGIYTNDVTATAGQPLAEGIEDLQIALGYDSTGQATTALTDNGGTSDSWLGNNSGDSGSPWTWSGSLTGYVRAVRVTLVARTTSQYIGNNKPFNRPAAEDHAASATFDGYRRRVLRTVVEMREQQESP